MVRGRSSAICVKNSDASFPQSIECLRAGHFMNKVPIDIKWVWMAFFILYDVCIPDLVKYGLRCQSKQSLVRYSLKKRNRPDAAVPESGRFPWNLL